MLTLMVDTGIGRAIDEVIAIGFLPTATGNGNIRAISIRVARVCRAGIEVVTFPIPFTAFPSAAFGGFRRAGFGRDA